MTKDNSKYCTFVTIFSQVSVFLPLALNAVALNPIDEVITEFINETYQHRWNITVNNEDALFIITLAQSMLMVGSLVGAFAARYTLMIMSRRTNLVLVHFMSVVSCVLMSPVAFYCKSYETLIAGRLINGFARGIGFTVVPLIVAETTSRATLALFQAPTVAIMDLGSAAGNILGYPIVLGSGDRWPYLLGISGIFSVAYLCLVPWLPETPTYLILQEEKSAKTTTKNYSNFPSFHLLRKLRSGDLETVRKEYEDIKDEIYADLQITKASLKEILTTKRYRRQFFGALVIYFSFQSTGIQAIVLYTDKIFHEAGIPYNQATLYTAGFFIVMALICFASTPILKRFGSRKMTLFGLVVTAFALAMLSASIELKLAYGSIAAIVLYAFGVSSGPLLCYAALASEITSQVIRPTALWSCGICYYTMASTVSFVTPYTVDWIGGYTYLIFVGLVVLDVIYIKFAIQDTSASSMLTPRITIEEATSTEDDESTSLLSGKKPFYGAREHDDTHFEKHI
ncbi:solute carrier family 2, facilitated glucose transporter member 5-like [Clavelina lepadiformis]|uniref:solute carrier family 2, facilitated glucose transporter member 5-like n=1 Tax=Clavelina lepadiformis TaxID=159417 RepID=UPI004042EFFA